MPQPENVATAQQSPTFSRILGEIGNAYPLRQRLFRAIPERAGASANRWGAPMPEAASGTHGTHHRKPANQPLNLKIHHPKPKI